MSTSCEESNAVRRKALPIASFEFALWRPVETSSKSSIRSFVYL